MFKHPNRRRIYLMRHGEAAYVNEDGTLSEDGRVVALTANGRIQARKQAAVLASVDFDRAVCSGLPRTRETATLLLSHRATPAVEVVPELEEIKVAPTALAPVDAAAWVRHVANPWAGADDPQARFLGGERFADFAGRVIPAFDAIITDAGWRSLLLVLHGAVNRMILNHVMGLSWQGRMSIEQDNCCLNIIDVDTDDDGAVERFLIRAVNVTAYDLNKSSVHLTNMEQTAERIATELGEGSRSQ